MREIRYNNATVRIRGNSDREKVKEAATIFLKKVQRSRRNGNSDSSREIEKE